MCTINALGCGISKPSTLLISSHGRHQLGVAAGKISKYRIRQPQTVCHRRSMTFIQVEAKDAVYAFGICNWRCTASSEEGSPRRDQACRRPQWLIPSPLLRKLYLSVYRAVEHVGARYPRSQDLLSLNAPTCLIRKKMGGPAGAAQSTTKKQVLNVTRRRGAQ